MIFFVRFVRFVDFVLFVVSFLLVVEGLHRVCWKARIGARGDEDAALDRG